jgi:hypothetical protein
MHNQGTKANYDLLLSYLQVIHHLQKTGDWHGGSLQIIDFQIANHQPPPRNDGYHWSVATGEAS